MRGQTISASYQPKTKTPYAGFKRMTSHLTVDDQDIELFLLGVGSPELLNTFLRESNKYYIFPTPACSRYTVLKSRSIINSTSFVTSMISPVFC